MIFMKKTLLTFVVLLLTGMSLWAQVPKGFNYQGVARSTTGVPLANTAINLRLTMHDGTPTGTLVYQESFNVTTNTFGLYNVVVGSGKILYPLGSTFVWPPTKVFNDTDGIFMQVEIDQTGTGTSYNSMGSTQLMSVPYALYAANGPTGAQGPAGPIGPVGPTGPTGPAGPLGPGIDSIILGTGFTPTTIYGPSGTINLPNVGTASTYGSGSLIPVFTTDAQGRVSSVTNTPVVGDNWGLQSAVTDLATLAGTGVPGNPLKIAQQGATPGQLLAWSGASWAPITASGTGTVTSVGTSAPLTGGPITATGTIGLAPTGTAGTYGDATHIPAVTTDTWGRISAVTVYSVSPGITSTGSANYITKFTAPTAITNSNMYEDPTTHQIGIGFTSPGASLDVETTDDMTGNFINNSGTAPSLAVVQVMYAGTDASTSSTAIQAQSIPDASINEGNGVVGLGGQTGVFGNAFNYDPTPLLQATGVSGQTQSDNDYSIGVQGYGSAYLFGPNYNYGVAGVTDGSGMIEDFAGKFAGDVDVTGTLTALSKSFKIDDPLDPANKFLYHACIESNEMLDVYSGNVTTDGGGIAKVTLPAYFEALNQDFRYQLTVMGGTFAQAIVSKEESGNSFEIKTNAPNVKVSWQITGVRHDPYANAHRVVAEVPKKGSQIGKYLSPKEYGKPASLQCGAVRPLPMKRPVDNKHSKNNAAPSKTNSTK
jgi:hypothetical protein